MRVLVLGGGGRLATAFSRMVAPGSGVELDLAPSPRSGSPRAIDVRDRELVLGAMEARRPDVVVHMASVTGLAADRDPELAHAVNAESLAHTVEGARRAGVRRVVLISSASVYGDRYSAPVAEDGRLDPRSVYARSKVRGEELLLEAAGEVEAVVLRLFNVFGPGFDDSLVTRLLRSTPQHPVELRAIDGFVRDYIAVEDAASALLEAIRASVALPPVINVGSGRPVATRELLTVLGRHRPLAYVETPGEPSYSCADPTLAMAHLGLRIDHPVADAGH